LIKSLVRRNPGLQPRICGIYGEGLRLGLEVGVVAVAVVKTTNVVVQMPGHEHVSGHS